MKHYAQKRKDAVRKTPSCASKRGRRNPAGDGTARDRGQLSRGTGLLAGVQFGLLPSPLSVIEAPLTTRLEPT